MKRFPHRIHREFNLPVRLCRFSRRRWWCWAALALSMILGRVALLPVLPLPEPQIHDEFSYLLSADTFAHGRLANPPLAMPEFFESPHVLVTPVYASKYQPGQGLVLAFGQKVFGHPYWGVVLSGAAMVFLFCWAADAWLPPQWTLLAGALATVLFFVRHYWFTSYWGGALVACGGALVAGAVGYILRGELRSARFSLSAGALVLFATRPYEGGILCLAAIGIIALNVARQDRDKRRALICQVILPNAIVAILAVPFVAGYNARVTGDPILAPYVVYTRQYDSVPPLWVLAPFPPRTYSNRNLDATWRNVQTAYWKLRQMKPVWAVTTQVLNSILSAVWTQFLTFGLLLLALPWTRLRNGKVWLAGLLFVGLLTLIPEIFPYPHYSAPFTAAELILIVAAGRAMWYRLAAAHWRGPIFLVALIVLFTPLGVDYAGAIQAHPTERGRLVRQLESQGGRHLVFVDYAEGWNSVHEWVYNGSDLNAAPVLFAHFRSDQENRQLVDHFPGRTTWIVRLGPAQSDIRLERYDPALDSRNNRTR